MTARSALRFTGRVVLAALVLTFVAVIGLQYVRIIERNVALAHSLHDLDADVARLHVERERKLREITRLEDPHGAIPEIHDRLHLVDPHEAIIYLKGGQPSAPPHD